MSRIDIAKLRKRAGMSQRELAGSLQVRPSFLSAIENGKSKLPEEKMEKLKDIFELESLADYYVDDSNESIVPPHTHPMDQTDSLTQLLNHFHDLAHQRNHDSRGEDSSRIDFLTRRNDKLSERLDTLRDEVDALRKENLRLQELLMKNNIRY